jgi:hypothetical protein
MSNTAGKYGAGGKSKWQKKKAGVAEVVAGRWMPGKEPNKLFTFGT